MENHYTEEELRAILKSIEGDATRDDHALVENWLKSANDNKVIYLQMKNIWEVSGRHSSIGDIDSGKALDRVMQSVSIRDSKPLFWRNVQRIAAAIMIPLIVAGFYLGRTSSGLTANENENETYREVFTAYGTRTHLFLSDGSSVWLNSGSRLFYPDRFEDLRRVRLEGEAYFEVESDARHPFIVEAGNLSIEATGTSFNVLASQTDPEIEVTLIEGSVDVNRLDVPDQSTSVITLEPRQHLLYDTLRQDFELEQQDPYRYISWKDGLLVFRNDPMTEVVKKIGQHYNVDIELHDEELQTYRYRATFENESFDEVMKLLKLSSPIDYQEQERTVLPDGTFTKRKVIISAYP